MAQSASQLLALSFFLLSTISQSLLNFDDEIVLLQDSTRFAPKEAGNVEAAAALRETQEALLQTPAELVQFSGNENIRAERRALMRHKLYCAKYPYLCAAPLHCDNAFVEEWEPNWWMSGLITVYREPNYKPFCKMEYSKMSVFAECLVNKDWKTFAQKRQAEVVEKGEEDFDASYCFLAGHCSNTAITYATTGDEAKGHCSDEYGHHWETVNYGMLPKRANPKSALNNATEARLFGMVSCATGIYHCDVLRCQETWCNDERYTKIYENLLSAEEEM